MPMTGEYLGIKLMVEDIDAEHLDYFRYLGEHNFHLQQCTVDGLIRYPPTTACPWCSNPDATWVPVEGKGTIHSYGEVHHAIMPQFREYLPYMILLVDLDTQKGKPSEHEAIRIVANLVEPDGSLASPETVKKAGIGTRVKMVYKDVGENFAIPQFTIDDSAPQPAPWRYAIE